jgi:hypothetical protein
VCSPEKEGVKGMLIVDGLIHLLNLGRFERLEKHLDFNKGHFLEVCQRYAEKNGMLSDGSPTTA